MRCRRLESARLLLLGFLVGIAGCVAEPIGSERPGPDAGNSKADDVPKAVDAGPGADADAPETASCPFEEGAEPRRKALFTKPGDKPDLTIENEFRRLVRAAVPGSMIRVSFYAFSRWGVADELVAAGKLGVDVRVVVDGLNRRKDPEGSDAWVPNEAMRRIRASLGDDAVVICSDDEEPQHLKGGCLSTGINHNKFAVFSELCDGSKDVVFQSSANFSRSQNDLHNNAVILRDDPGLYAGYLQYWRDEAAKLTIRDYFRQVDGQRTRAWFFPRPKSSLSNQEPSTDTIYNLLGNVSCSDGTRVRVAMAFWNDSRDYLVDRLSDLKDQGCDVGIVANQNTTSDGVVAKLRAAFSADEARLVEHNHNKYLFVDGGYVNARRKLVWTGSHNWVFGSIRTNEETILRIDDPDVFAAFAEDWEEIRAGAAD